MKMFSSTTVLVATGHILICSSMANLRVVRRGEWGARRSLFCGSVSGWLFWGGGRCVVWGLAGARGRCYGAASIGGQAGVGGIEGVGGRECGVVGGRRKELARLDS